MSNISGGQGKWANGILTITWKINKPLGNGIIVKFRPKGSREEWRVADSVEVSATTISVMVDDMDSTVEYETQISQVTYGSPYTFVIPAASTDIVISAQPSGPAVPADGWKCVVADGFNRPTLSQLWGPNADDNNGRGSTAIIPPPNADEVAGFAASQVIIQPDGLHLSAIYVKGAGGPGKDYVSGVVISQNYVAGEPGQKGFPITGFRFLPTPGVIWVLESVITMPDMTDPGQDPGWWLSNPAWDDEIDFPEAWAYGKLPYGYGMVWINNTSTGAETSRTAYGDPALTDGKAHRWTHELNGITKRWENYLDGVHRPDLSMDWPASFTKTPMYQVFSHGMRNDYGTPPMFTTGSKEMIIHSNAVYVWGPNPVYTGGLIAPGTVVK